MATWAGATERSGRGGGRRRRHDDGDDGDDGGGQNVRNNISFNLEKNELKSGIKGIDRAKKKFSTETGFERGKTAAISFVISHFSGIRT